MSASMYCRKCGYQLRGLSANQCPECGRLFDPSDPGTFLHNPRAWNRRRWCKRIGLAAGLLALIIALGIGGLWGHTYWKYHADWLAEHRAVLILKGLAAGKQVQFNSKIRRSSSGRMLDWLCAPINYLRDRTTYISLSMDDGELPPAALASLIVFKHLRELELRTAGLTDSHLGCLKDKPYLTRLEIGGPRVYIQGHHVQITDAGLCHLASLTQLTYLSVDGSGITGNGLRHLRALTALTWLQLSNTRISDDDLGLLKAFPSLQVLELGGAPIHGAGLTHLRALPNLRSLNLANTQITDAGLENLKGAQSFRSVILQSTNVSQAGVDSLRRALPSARIYGPQGEN